MERVSSPTVEVAQKWGFEKQSSEHKQSLNVTQSLIGIIQEKCELQSNYARGMSRLSTRLRETLGSAPSCTVHDCWLRICNVLEYEAKIHQNSALGLLEGLVQPWIELIEDLAKSRKPLKHQVERATHQLLTLSASELRAKKKLCAAYRACERTWFGHVQSIRARAKPISINGESNILDETEPVINSTAALSSIPKRQLRAYHSFRDRSLDLESNSSASNTLDLPGPRAPLRRYSSARSATLPSPSSTLQSSDSSGVLATKIAPAVNKTKEACYSALCDYYKASMSAEEARVEWHTVLLKCLDEQRSLERQRLNAMVNGLTVYQRMINEAIPELKAMATEITDALRLADPSADIAAFRKRSCADPPANGTCNAATDSASASPNHTSGLKPVVGVVGRSQQRLLDLPGERSMLQHLLSQQSGLVNGGSAHPSSGKLTSDKSTRSPSSGLRLDDFNLRSHLRECLTRECLFDHLDLLAKDVQKERRTKQGLSNLVQVYSREPAYADAQTLTEVRRRLFVSRVRLTHLTNCRQKLIYSLICALPSGQNGASGPPKHIYVDALIRAGFINLPWSVTPSTETQSVPPQPPAVRWVPIPDLDDESTVNKLTKPLEWPPFPSTELPYEDLNDDLFEWEIERLRLLDADQRENGPWDPIPLSNPFMMDLTSNSLKVLSSTLETAVPNSKSSSHIVIDRGNTISDLPSKRWSGEYQTPHLYQPFRPNQLKFGSAITNGSDVSKPFSSVSRSLDGQFDSENKKPAAVIPRPELIVLSKSPSLAKQEQSDSEVSAQSPVSPVNLKRSASSGRSRLSGFSFVRLRRPSLSSHSTSVKRTQSFDRASHRSMETSAPSNRITIEYAGAPDEVTESTTVTATKHNGTHSFSSKILSRFRSSGRQSKENKTGDHSITADSSLTLSDFMRSSRPTNESSEVKCNAIDPSRTSMELGASTGTGTRTVHFGTVELHAITPDIDCKSNGSQWPSNLSLHCLGWAKVERAYVAKSPDELTLLEGDIISICRKENSEWWYGEANGAKGRFPVSHVDEF